MSWLEFHFYMLNNSLPSSLALIVPLTSCHFLPILNLYLIFFISQPADLSPPLFASFSPMFLNESRRFLVSCVTDY